MEKKQRTYYWVNLEIGRDNKGTIAMRCLIDESGIKKKYESRVSTHRERAEERTNNAFEAVLEFIKRHGYKPVICDMDDKNFRALTGREKRALEEKASLLYN